MSDIFYPIVVWQPTESMVEQLDTEVAQLTNLVDEREAFITFVHKVLDKHCHAITVLMEILSEDKLIYDYNKRIEEDHDPEEGTDPDLEQDIPEDLSADDEVTENEARQNKGVTREHLTRCKRRYYSIQKMCHPDVAIDISLHEYAYRAMDLMLAFNLHGLIECHARAKDQYNRLVAIRTVTPMLRRYFELQDEKKALDFRLSEIEEDYTDVSIYTQNPMEFKEIAKTIKLEELEELVLELKGILPISVTLKDRIREFLPDVFTAAKTDFVSDLWGNLERNTNKDSSHEDFMNSFRSINEENEDDEDNIDGNESAFKF